MTNDAKLRRIHRLMDEVYREMFRLEAGYPGAEMGLALALLRSWTAANVRKRGSTDWDWLNAISPMGLRLIENSLNRSGSHCSRESAPQAGN